MWSAFSCMWRLCVCVCVCVGADDPAAGSFASLAARPGEALMWQRQCLWSAGLTLWCCGWDAEPVSTNPISITLAASYLWLGWPSALPPSRKSSPLSSALARSLSLLRPTFLSRRLSTVLSIYLSLLLCLFFFYYIFCPSLPALQPNRNPMAIILMQHPINPRQEDARNSAAYKNKK